MKRRILALAPLLALSAGTGYLPAGELVLVQLAEQPTLAAAARSATA